MALHVFVFVVLLVVCLLFSLTLLWLLDWVPLRPSSSRGGAKRNTLHRLLKPRTPDDCPACRLGSRPWSGRGPAPAPVNPWSEVKSRRGAPKRVNTDGYACPNRNCPYFGYAVTTARPAICQNLRTNPAYLPVRVEVYEESAVAYPLLQGERVGGCLLVASVQEDFFTPPRLQLVNAYADLAVLALLDEQFYEKQAIQLRTMPATDVQQAHFASFRRRVNELISTQDRQVANIVQAEQLVWSQLAEELMSLNP